MINQVIYVLSRYIFDHRRCIFALSVAVFTLLFIYTSEFTKTAFHTLTSLQQFPDAIGDFDILPNVTLHSASPETFDFNVDLFSVNFQPLPTRSPESRNSTRSWTHRRVALNGTYIRPKIVILGMHRLQTDRQFAVFSTDSVSSEHTFAFLLPLTTLAWRRLGYGSIVLIVGELKTWTQKPTLEHILRHTLEKEAVVVFLEGVPQRHAIMMSQCCRLFAVSLLSSTVDLNSTVLITSDADFWPLRSDLFRVPPIVDPPEIISTNSFCCSPFHHKGRQHRMLPLTSVVASGTTWRSMVAQKGTPPRTTDEIMHYMEREFGALARTTVSKGENDGWFMDQHLVSLLIEDWVQIKGNLSVRFIERDISHDRIDGNRWQPWSLDGLVDAHVLQGTYKPAIWRKIQPLLKLMFGWTAQEYIWCEEYRKGFMELHAPLVY